jgi:hypothetical protein
MQLFLFYSLIITGFHVSTWQGMILGPARIFLANNLDKVFGKRLSRILQKPLWDCLPCMAGIWTIMLMWEFDLLAILAVCGLNAVIDSIISHSNPENGSAH